MNSIRTEMDLRFPDRLLTPAQVAAALNVSKPFVYKLLRNGEIAVVRIGRSVRVLPSDLLAFITQNTERNPVEEKTAGLADKTQQLMGKLIDNSGEL